MIRVIRFVVIVILGVIDFIFYHVARPFGFIGRSLHDGWLAGYYSVEYALMLELQETGPDNKQQEEESQA